MTVSIFIDGGAGTTGLEIRDRIAGRDGIAVIAIEEARRKERQQTTKDRGWASKSLLEREMERERERQKEWEQSQRELASVAKDPAAGTGEGQSWDVNQYGYMGGDSQNRGGISFGGKRQILGPRPFGPR